MIKKKKNVFVTIATCDFLRTMPAAAVGKSFSCVPPPIPPVATATLWVGLVMWVWWLVALASGQKLPWPPKTQIPLNCDFPVNMDHAKSMQSWMMQICPQHPPAMPCPCERIAHEGQSCVCHPWWRRLLNRKYIKTVCKSYNNDYIIIFYLIVQQSLGGCHYFFI